MFCSSTVLPVRGGATIRARWPLPLGLGRGGWLRGCRGLWGRGLWGRGLWGGGGLAGLHGGGLLRSRLLWSRLRWLALAQLLLTNRLLVGPRGKEWSRLLLLLGDSPAMTSLLTVGLIPTLLIFLALFSGFLCFVFSSLDGLLIQDLINQLLLFVRLNTLNVKLFCYLSQLSQQLIVELKNVIHVNVIV
jgi:hypothetical protein